MDEDGEGEKNEEEVGLTNHSFWREKMLEQSNNGKSQLDSGVRLADIYSFLSTICGCAFATIVAFTGGGRRYRT